eukprot:UN00559
MSETQQQISKHKTNEIVMAKWNNSQEVVFCQPPNVISMAQCPCQFNEVTIGRS